ncbi:MAG: SPOR domain-containing protein, partial [Spirochaetota bacterium]
VILAAIIGVGIWLFYPRDAAELDQLADAEGGLEWEPLDYIRGDGEVPGLEADDEPEEDFVVTYGVAEDEDESREARPAVVTEAPGDEADPAAADQPQADEPHADEPRTPGPAAVTDRQEPARDTGADRVAARDSGAPARTTPSVSETAGARTAPPPQTTPSAPERPRETPELADRAYWVQAISSPNRYTVEQAQRTLGEHQLGTRILTKEIGDTVYYRLRLGPFAVREEAEKFLGWVTDVDGFEDAMIFVDYTTRVLAARPR